MLGYAIPYPTILLSFFSSALLGCPPLWVFPRPIIILWGPRPYTDTIMQGGHPPPYCMGFLLNWRPHNTVNNVALLIQKYACAIYRRYTSACKSEICKSIVEFYIQKYACATYRRYTSACKHVRVRYVKEYSDDYMLKLQTNCKTVRTRWCCYITVDLQLLHYKTVFPS